MFFGMWLVWILGGLGVFFFGGLLGIGDWAYFFLATGLLAGASAAVNRILERLRDLDKRLQQLQAQLDRLTQGLSSEWKIWKNPGNPVGAHAVRPPVQRAASGNTGAHCAPLQKRM